jgi:hypothetical protein
MTSILSTFKAAGRALLIATMLGAGAMTAAPAFAQSGDPAPNFNIGGGALQQNQGSPSLAPDGQGQMRPDGQGQMPPDQPGYRGDFRFNFCMSDRDVIRGLTRYGFRRVQVHTSSRTHAEALGRWGRYDWLMDVDKCTGEVDILRRIERNRFPGGFGFQFNFGN